MDRGRRSSRSRSRSRDRSRSRGRDRSRDRPAGARLADKRVYISNIPYDSRWQDIKDLFRKEVGEVSFVELFNDENDKPRGCGIIEFDNGITAKKAIEKMHRYELGGRKIVVKEDYDVERDKSGRIITQGNNNNSNRGRDVGGGRGGDRDRSRDDRDRERGEWDRREPSPQGGQGGGGWKYGNTYGLSQQFIESLGIDGPLISKVFISNLDFRVDEKKLKEVFRLAGRVLFVDVNKDKDGKSRGHGTIEFEHPVEAVQAISMFNNQQLFERRMHVKMDRLSDPIADLQKNRLPEGLKGVGMGLGLNGTPLVDVSRNLPSNNNVGNISSLLGGGNSSGGNLSAGNNPLANNLGSLAMNMGMGVGNLATAMMTPQALESLSGLGVPSAAAAAAAAAAANAFGVAGMGPLGALNTTANPFGAALTMGAGGIGGMQPNPVVGNPMALGNTGGLGVALGGGQGGGGQGGVGSGSGNMGGGQNQQSSFQNNSGGGQGGPNNQNFRDEYGYSASVYSTPSNNYNTAYQREKQQFGNGSGGNNSGGGGGGNSVPSNTVIVSNLPPSCTWQGLKTKFRECGEVVFAEMRDKATGIVRFQTERDAERAVKVFDQSRVDGRIVDVRFL